jgi:murein DD-endopeptidase MepM/ murein hydrolase activator NlpD
VAQGGAGRRSRRIEIRVRLFGSTDVAFGIALRRPRRRRRARDTIRQWTRAVMIAGCCVVAACAPAATVAAAPELRLLGALVWPPPKAPDLARATFELAPRAAVRARVALVTAVREEPPALRAHVVERGDTLLSIAARYGITPQTLAYNNGLADSADLRVGQSLVVPPIDAAIHVVREGEALEEIAARFGLDADAVRAANRVAFDPADVTSGRPLLLPVPDSRYPGFRLRVSDPPRVFAPRVRWPTAGIVTQLYSSGHSGVDIAAPYGSPIVAGDSGTVSAVGWRGPGGLAVCVMHDWGLETCYYHTASVSVELGERVVAGQQVASVGSSGLSTGAHVHWEARTNGALVDPLTYVPAIATVTRVGGATGSP